MPNSDTLFIKQLLLCNSPPRQAHHGLAPALVIEGVVCWEQAGRHTTPGLFLQEIG